MSSKSDERDLSRWYWVDCQECSFKTEVSSYGGAEVEGMAHEDHAGVGHRVQIIRQSDEKVLH